MLELSKVQDNEVGDGTTSVTVLACELLRVCMHQNLTYFEIPSSDYVLASPWGLFII